MTDAAKRCIRSSVVFFFFQAEDGIRDYKVTGVQTCALPICSHGWHSENDRRGGNSMTYLRVIGAGMLLLASAGAYADPRSEERRGGEEGRSRWSPYH